MTFRSFRRISIRNFSDAFMEYELLDYFAPQITLYMSKLMLLKVVYLSASNSFNIRKIRHLGLRIGYLLSISFLIDHHEHMSAHTIHIYMSFMIIFTLETAQR